MFNSHHRLSIQIPDQEEQQSLRKALRHKDSGGTHLPKNLSAAIKQFIVVYCFNFASFAKIVLHEFQVLVFEQKFDLDAFLTTLVFLIAAKNVVHSWEL